MDYAILPPEINSARMYTGPGAGSMLAAAESWDALGAELGITASSYESVLSGLTTLQWRGAASESMMAVVQPYVGWLSTTAEQAQQSAMQARAAALAYEQAYAMTVAPPAIAANRMQLTALIATNFFGQNTAAIAATEARLRGDVGPGRHGNVRLRCQLGGGNHTDAVRLAAADNQSGRAGRAERLSRPSELERGRGRLSVSAGGSADPNREFVVPRHGSVRATPSGLLHSRRRTVVVFIHQRRGGSRAVCGEHPVGRASVASIERCTRSRGRRRARGCGRSRRAGSGCEQPGPVPAGGGFLTGG